MYSGFNHVPLITDDMDKTVRFYRDLMGFPLIAGVGTEEFRHYMFQVTPGNHIAFFSHDAAQPMELKRHGVPTDIPLGFDHLAIGVTSKANLFTLKDRVEAAGFPVTGPIDHGTSWSIYFFDPNNIPLEVAWHCLEILTPPVLADPDPVRSALEGSEPQEGLWPPVTRPTPEREWKARPGAGMAVRKVAEDQCRGRVFGD